MKEGASIQKWDHSCQMFGIEIWLVHFLKSYKRNDWEGCTIIYSLIMNYYMILKF